MLARPATAMALTVASCSTACRRSARSDSSTRVRSFSSPASSWLSVLQRQWTCQGEASLI